MNKKDRIILLFILIITIYFLCTIFYLLKAETIQPLEGGDIKKAQETNQYY